MKNERARDELIDLGVASIETKGQVFGKEDTGTGLIPRAGLTNE